MRTDPFDHVLSNPPPFDIYRRIPEPRRRHLIYTGIHSTRVAERNEENRQAGCRCVLAALVIEAAVTLAVLAFIL